MCEVRYCDSRNSLVMLQDEEQEHWVACGRKLRRSQTDLGFRSNQVGESKEALQNDNEPLADIPLELCDPMRRKITALKPSLTPGAGTRIVRRRKPQRQEFMEEPISETAEAFRQWREAMRAMARLPEGIPSQFRRRIWLLLASHHLDAQHINWPRLAASLFAPQPAPAAAAATAEADARLGRQIDKDLHRTGCGITEADRAALKRVLTAYARWNRRVGYCQGFNILASVILDVMSGDEQGALKVMIYLIDYVLPESYFTRNLQALSVDVAVFRELLALRQPALTAHLQKLQRDAAMEAAAAAATAVTNFAGAERAVEAPPLTDLFAVQWFVTLFATCLPVPTLLRVWDAVLLEGSEVGLRAGLVVMQILEPNLMRLSSADRFYSSMNEWIEEVAAGERTELEKEFVGLLYDLAPLPWPRLADLRRHYAAAVAVAAEERRADPGPPAPASYGDGYDEQARHAKARSSWWWPHTRLSRRQAKSSTLHPASPSPAKSKAPLPPNESKAIEIRQNAVNHKQASAADSSPLQVGSHCSSPSSSSSSSSSQFQSVREVPPGELSDTNANEKLQIRYNQQVTRSAEVEKLKVEEGDLERGRTSYQIDDSFLQTIYEWQRRNVAVMVSSESGDSEDEAPGSTTPSSISSPDMPFCSPMASSTEASPAVPRLKRTLLSIATRKKMEELVASSNEVTPTSLPISPSHSLKRSLLLARAIQRDRTGPKVPFTGSPATASVAMRQGLASPTPRPTSPQQSPQSGARAATNYPTKDSTSSPPWAAAMAAVGAAKARLSMAR